MPAPALSLSLFNHHTDVHYETLRRDKVLERAHKLVKLAREKGLRALRASTDPLVEIGMEAGERGRVTKNSLGVLDLSWQAARHPEWPGMVRREIEEIRAGIRAAHGAELCNLIWTGMGGSAEDKVMYQALGLLDGGVRVYILDSTDPAKLEAILASLVMRGPLARVLPQTLVAGMAMGMTSYEPVLNLEKLDLVYRKHKVPSQANFLYMTLPGSLLDQFAGPRGYRRVELQLDNDNTTAGRHSGPLTRGSLYPLALNGVDLEAWMAAAVLSGEEIQEAFRLAAFLHGNGVDSRDKVTLLLPREWAGAGIWTKQDFEESLGKSEQLGIKIFPAHGPGPAALLPARHDGMDRIFWAVNVAGCDNPEAAGLKQLREAGHPLAVLEVQHAMPLPKYMQLVHYAVFGLACLRRMNFVTQPSVELYKAIANRLHGQARKAGGIERIKPWRALRTTRLRARASGGITLYYDSLVATRLVTSADLPPRRAGAPAIYAAAFRRLREQGKIEYAELTFYGDMRYRPAGRRLREVLDAAADAFGKCLGLSTDVYEGPAMNHSYHEMIIGHGRCFSTVLLAEKQTTLTEIGYRPDYHRAQWLATKLALEQRGRPVLALTFPDLSSDSLRALRGFFRRVAEQL
ncbi:MAG TPA: hypothetical protein VEU62_21315 [Bryobacterales bacterium]|nr:hypothetical protein [Bryobacterales bacterium]